MVRIKMKEKAEKIADWIKKEVEKANQKGVVVGLSGGIDSACVAALCKKAFPDNTLGIVMPCISNPQDMKHAELIAETFNIPIKIIDLEENFKVAVKTLTREDFDKEKHSNNLAIANIKPRLRMIVLYYFSSKLNYLVAGTDNKSEEMIGYFTKYGDGGVDILPIVDLFKRDVKKLAECLGVPEEIINKKPSAGLWEGQTDENEIGISYDELDKILYSIDRGDDLSDFDGSKILKVKKMIKVSEHKRRMPHGCILNE